MGDLLQAYPWLKEELPEIHPNFSMLKTPVARIMIPKVTLGVMCERTGMEMSELISKIQERIEQHR